LASFGAKLIPIDWATSKSDDSVMMKKVGSPLGPMPRYSGRVTDALRRVKSTARALLTNT